MSSLTALGIIAEYNPFHNGHAYHIAQSRQLTGADCVVVVMSGNFIQRGEPALVDKYTRAEMALQNGADLVIELPVIAACSSAPYFAKGSMALLHELQIPMVCFGSESGDLSAFNTITDLLQNNSSRLDNSIREYVAAGLSYPLARSRAIKDILCKDTTSSQVEKLLSLPNNILGIEYMLEIKKNNYAITPVTITRSGSDYNDSSLSGALSSATAIRNSILHNDIIPKDPLPANVYNTLVQYADAHYFPTVDDFSEIIFYRLLELEKQRNLSKNNSAFTTSIADLPDYLLNKLFKAMKSCHTVTELIESVKSKDLTYTRISRALLHLLLNITNEHYATFNQTPCSYIRILGLNDTGALYLSSIKKNLHCPLISKPANFAEYLKDDIFASDLYNMIVNRHSRHPLVDDYRHRIIKQ